MYQQTHLLAKCSKVAMIVNFLDFNVHIRAQEYMGWIEMIQQRIIMIFRNFCYRTDGVIQ